MVDSKVDKNLVNYIWNYLHQGYTLDAIRQSLLQQGYTKTLINATIDYIYANYYYSKHNNSYQKPFIPQQSDTSSSSSKIHHGVLYVFIIMGIVLIGGSFIFVLMNTGDSLEFEDRHNDDYDSLYQNIPQKKTSFDNDDNEIIDSSSQNEDSDTSYIDENTEIKKQVSTEKFDASKTYTSFQIEQKISEIGKKNPAEAIKFCDLLEGIKVYYCYKDIAVISRNSQYCEKIDKQSIKDNCYFQMVLEDIDNNVCHLIQENYIRKNCENIININEREKEFQILKEKVEDMDTNETSSFDSSVAAEFY